MFDWKILAVTAPLLFVTYQSLSKLLPKGAPTFLINAYASLVGFVVMIALHLLTSTNKSLELSSKFLYLALGIGALIALGNFGIIKAYTLGAPQSIFSPLFYVIVIAYATAFGLIFWHEKLYPLQIVGLVMSILGIILIIFSKK